MQKRTAVEAALRLPVNRLGHTLSNQRRLIKRHFQSCLVFCSRNTYETDSFAYIIVNNNPPQYMIVKKTKNYKLLNGILTKT